MVSVEEAKELILKTTYKLTPIQRELPASLNYVLAEDIISPISYPPFDQSAMDGFAILHSDIAAKKSIDIIGEVPAGYTFPSEIVSGKSVRIFTGAKIPEGADAVVIQEKILIEKGHIIYEEASVQKGTNIRHMGSQIKKGDIALNKNTILTPGAIGFLSGLGITEVMVYPRPRISIVATGSELQKPGQPLVNGQIYESNTYALKTALESLGIDSVNISVVGDEEGIIRKAISSAIQSSDIVLVSGGISVGKYDFVGKVFQELGVENIFYKIYQKPGKPIYFGSKGNCLLFGLPGNSASALTCFYEYVFPAIRTMQNHKDAFLRSMYLPSLTSYPKKAGLSLFLKSKILGGKVEIVSGQESNNIGSFAVADALIYLPAEKTNLNSGELVEVHLLPF